MVHDYNSHVRRTNISTLKRDLSRYLDYVRRGGTVRVFDRDTPVADIVPLSERAATSDRLKANLERLERAGAIRRGDGRLPESFFTRELPKAGASALEALLEERRNSR